MKRSQWLTTSVLAILIGWTVLTVSCGGGGHRVGGGGGSGVEGQTTILGNLADTNDQISGVQVCVEGTDPPICVITDENGNFSVTGDFSGDLLLSFTDSTSGKTLCLSGVADGATVTLGDVSCTVADGLCVPGSITADPEPATAIEVCNQSPTPTPTQGEGEPTPTPTPVQAGDDDGDGVPNESDLCPNTPAGAVVDSNGCSVDQLVLCSGPASGGSWINHGDYVSSVADVTRDFVQNGLISEEDRNLIVESAAQSDCGKSNDPEPTPTPTPTPNPGPDDSDGDGVSNQDDLCPDTAPGAAVDAHGCSVAQLVPCGGEWSNHGEYVAAVADTTREFVDAGLLTHLERADIVNEAARSDCGKQQLSLLVLRRAKV